MAASDNGDMDSTEENPINQKATKKTQNSCRSSEEIKESQIKQTDSK